MIKKKMKIDRKESSILERHFGVILEDIDAKLDLVVEGHQSLDIKIDKNHREFQEFREEVNYKFDVVFEKFDEIDVQFKNVKDELHVIHGELKEKVGRDEFTLLEKRAMVLEKSRK